MIDWVIMQRRQIHGGHVKAAEWMAPIKGGGNLRMRTKDVGQYKSQPRDLGVSELPVGQPCRGEGDIGTTGTTRAPTAYMSTAL
jgi:hypothetical protein